jgi:hypothetical protein
MVGLFGGFQRQSRGGPPSLFVDPVSLAGDFYGSGRVSDSPRPMDERADRMASIGRTVAAAAQDEDQAAEQLRALHANIDADPNLPTPEAKAYAKANPKAYVEAYMQQFDQRQGGGEPDYTGHAALHGRGPDGRLPKRDRSTGDKILRGLRKGLLAYGAAQGNPMSVYRLKQMEERRDARRKQDTDYAAHERYVNAMLRKGMSLDDAELAAANMNKFSEEFSTRYRTREMDEGDTLSTPELDGSMRTYTAPKTLMNGPDVVRLEGGQGLVPAAPRGMFGGYGRGRGLPMLPGANVPDSATMRAFGLPSTPEGFAAYQRIASERPDLIPSAGPQSSVIFRGKSDAVRAAEEAGLKPGTDDFKRFIQNYHLDGQGPTAWDMNERDNATSRYATDAGTRNNMRTTATARENAITAADRPMPVLNARGEVVAYRPVSGRTTTLQGSRPVAGSGRGGRGGRRGGAAPRIAVNPRTGERVMWNGKDWVPAR